MPDPQAQRKGFRLHRAGRKFATTATAPVRARDDYRHVVARADQSAQRWQRRFWRAEKRETHLFARKEIEPVRVVLDDLETELAK